MVESAFMKASPLFQLLGGRTHDHAVDATDDRRNEPH
jgi:hypothetical protein